MKDITVIEQVDFIRCLHDLLESSYFSAKERKIFREKLLEIISNL